MPSTVAMVLDESAMISELAKASMSGPSVKRTRYHWRVKPCQLVENLLVLNE